VTVAKGARQQGGERQQDGRREPARERDAERDGDAEARLRDDRRRPCERAPARRTQSERRECVARRARAGELRRGAGEQQQSEYQLGDGRDDAAMRPARSTSCNRESGAPTHQTRVSRFHEKR
jgi:hypothetical protein